MGDESVDSDAPTQLGEAEDETRAVTAWSQYEYEEEKPRVNPRLVTGLAVAGSLVAIVAAAVLVGYKLNDVSRPEPVAASPSSSESMVPAKPPVVPLPSTVTVQAPPPQGPPPLPPAPPKRSAPGTYTTYIAWSGSRCLAANIPTGPSREVSSTCNGGTDTLTHTATSGQLVGMDPIMGDATAIACKVVADATGVVLIQDSGTAGDGQDVNCITTAP